MEDKLSAKMKKARIIACCGSGGVGKTTISAVLGFQGAMQGKKTLVLTIDPARRLADSLGFSALEHEEQRIPHEKFTELGLNPRGELYAMMLDTRRMFDRIIEQYSSSEKMRENVLNNRYYQHISSTLAGSHEYMAMEKLYEIHQRNDYDLIVLDTPPTRNALDFLDAPERLTNLLGNNLFRRILNPGAKKGMGMKMISFLTSPVQKMITRMMGKKVMEDLFDFFHLGNDLIFDGFMNRGKAVKELLSGPESLFFAVASPMSLPMREALFLYETIMEYGIPFGGFIINRVHREFRQDTILEARAEYPGDPLMAKLRSVFEDYRKMGEKDARAIHELISRAGPDVTVRKIPYFENDVYDFSGLYRIYRLLEDASGRKVDLWKN